MSIRIIFCSAFLGALLSISAPVSAWGDFGHEVVAHLAVLELSPAARQGVDELLGDQSLAGVSTWADEVRPDRAETAPLHYINGPVDELEPRKADYRLEAGNVYSAILGYAERLADDSLSRPDRREALKFLVHFIGDVHQPLHCGFAEDRGGNDIPVILEGEDLNFHRYWDREILAPAYTVYSAAAFSAILHHRHTDRIQSAWADPGHPRDWVIESRELIFSGIYPMPRSDAVDDGSRVGVIGDRYGEIWRPVAERRLARAGARLAATLNAIFETDQSPFDSPPIPFPPSPVESTSID